ncbi:putative membrane protein [Candidatus Campylobacter infans]|uniref:Putative membrane protein n=1 Tax=Candidatus Campylobacter infans TaxID=2561898 RepID=A0A7H9CJD4_9BACT|nr:hypothetical protein [Candidatus Campylobacter infans]QLI05405.1 putative membrane protein [Candidatus Campylobacter infans]
MRDYDKEPLIIKTEQLHLFLFDFVWCLIGISVIYIGLEDAFGERKTHYPMAGVAIGLSIIFMSIYSIIKVKKSPKLFTKIYNDKIIRDYIFEDNKVKIWEIKNPYKVTWYFKSIWPKEKVKDGKNILYYAFRLIFWALGMLLFLVLFAINKFKLQKYYIIENDDYIFSVKMTDETKEFFGETKFSWKIHLI